MSFVHLTAVGTKQAEPHDGDSRHVHRPALPSAWRARPDRFIALPAFATMPRAARSQVAAIALPLALLAALGWLIWHVPSGLSEHARMAIIVFVGCIIGWTLTRISDAAIALAGALALVLGGVVSHDQMFSTLGDDLVWLLVGAFVLAAVLRASGLSERLALACVRRLRTLRALFYGLTLAISATAFLIPSTSARAALLLPVFLAIAAQIGDARRVRALALLFPTAILLSAAGSLIGAGAHLIAADFIRQMGGPALDMLGWLQLALPFALLTTLAATEIILRLFLTGAERASTVALADLPPLDLSPRDLALMGLMAGTLLCWLTAGLHGVHMAVVTLAAALIATLPGISTLTLKSAVKSVEWELLLFMAATLLMGEALLATNADEWVARRLVMTLGNASFVSVPLIAGTVIVLSLLAHLVITSRTARVTVLVPTIVLPLAGLGLDPTALILIAVMGTGFCQTLAASAKPVALFSSAEVETFGRSDLARLSLALAPMMIAALVAFAFVIWPLMGIRLTL